MTQPAVYSLPARVLHWTMAVLLLSLLLAGLAMVQSLAAWQPTLLAAHKAFGLFALLLALARLGVRWVAIHPPLPAALPPLQQQVARHSHTLLYALMLAMPLSGLLMQGAAGRPVSILGVFAVPALLSADLATYAAFRELHGILAWCLIALVLLHISAALHHALIRRDGLLRRML